MAIDESAFHDARRQANPRPCAFENALLARCFECSFVRRLNIAERESLGCADAARQEACVNLRAHLRQNAAFALKLAHPQSRLSHAGELKIQCGGLQGLQTTLVAAGEDDQARDVAAMVHLALRKYHALDRLPYGEIVRAIAAFHVRRRLA